METLPQLKGVVLDTTSFGWIDLEYCKKRGIVVSNCPNWSRESIAEHTLVLLLCLAKKIIITDRRTQKNQYKLETGFELKGKTLGVIGLGSIGSRTAELGKAIGMNVLAYNHSSKIKEGVQMKNLDEVLNESDAIAIHITHTDDNKHFLNAEKLGKLKQGVIIVYSADREMVDEVEMAEALKSGQVQSYAFEGEDLEKGPLSTIENAIGLKGFAWNTKEAWENVMQI